MWLVQMAICHKRKIRTEFQKLGTQKECKNLISNCNMIIFRYIKLNYFTVSFQLLMWLLENFKLRT